MSISTIHTCDNCSEEPRRDECYCESCLEEMKEEEYKKGFEDGKKEALSENK